MNKIEKQKGQLKAISIIIMVISVIIMGVGILMIVSGSTTNSGLGMKFTLILFGILFALIGLAGIAFGLVFLITGKSLTATRGSVAEDNLGKGTINMTKCSNCGSEIVPGNNFCGKCGNNLAQTKICSSCGATINVDEKVCTNCGAEV